jgi:hypothetical protein
MMTSDARSAHERLATKLRTATQHLDGSTRELAATTAASYAAALVAAHDNRECAWRAFVTQVSSLADALERAPLRTPEIISELRSLVQENADLLEAGADRAVFQLEVHVAY